MANYKPGEETKSRILKVSKELFYNNGLKNTTYNQISKKANVNIGTIVYHFGSIENIGQIIYREILANRRNVVLDKINTLFPDRKIDDALLALVEYRLNTDSYIRFPDYTRFITEIMGILDTWEHVDLTESGYKLSNRFGYEYNEKELFMQKLLFLPFANLVVNESKQVNFELTAKDICDYHTKVRLLSLGVSSIEIDEFLRQVDEIAEKISLTVNASFEIY